MKYAKKMIMVPEAEYLALLGATKGGDSLQNEKALLDAQIRQNLEDPNIKPDIKAKRHGWLYKIRRQVKELSENKPQKVIIETAGQDPNLAPYLGIKKQPKIEQSEEEPRKFRMPKLSLKSEGEESDQSLATSNETMFTARSPSSSEKSTLTTNPPLIHPSFLQDLFTYVSGNKDKFKITAKGKIQSNTNLPIEASNYKDVLKYLTGKQKETPRGTKFLKDRLLKDPNIKEYINVSKGMWGEGKKKRRKVIVQFKGIKTPGITREAKPFKPIIWAKL